MSFRDDCNRFKAKVEARHADIFVGVVDAAHESIVEGSPVTGAPGQPVDTGALKASWIKSFDSDTEASITTNKVYAPGIEDAIGPHGPIQLRSEVGGFHSVKLTTSNFDQLVDHVAREVVATDGR